MVREKIAIHPNGENVWRWGGKERKGSETDGEPPKKRNQATSGDFSRSLFFVWGKSLKGK